MPVATATASPPLVPPGVRCGSHGLTVSPNSWLTVCTPAIARSGMLVRPIGIAPAARSRRTGGASAFATQSRKYGTPCVVAEPATWMFSFTVKGTPASGPSRSPAARRRSVSRAACRAPSSSSRVTAFTRGLTAAIRSRCASTAWAADTSPDATSFASADASSAQSSLVVPIGPSLSFPAVPTAPTVRAVPTVPGNQDTDLYLNTGANIPAVVRRRMPP